MTEAEWLAADDPVPMRKALRTRATDRRLRLFGCACVRRAWHLIPDRRSRRAVEHRAHPPWPGSLPLRLQFLQEFVDGPVHVLAADVAVADHAVGVEDVDRRPAADVPRLGDRPAGPLRAVPERPPGDLLLLQHLLELLPVRIGVDA